MWISVPKRREYCIRHISCIHNLRLKTSKKERSFYHQKIMKGEKMVKGRNIKFCKRILSIVLAVVMTVGMMNSPMLVEQVKAADVTITFSTTDGNVTGGNARIYIITSNEAVSISDYLADGQVKNGTFMEGGTNGTWTATIDESVKYVSFLRVANDSNYYWQYCWMNTERGNNTAFKVTNAVSDSGNNGTSGTGAWSGGSSEVFTFTVKDCHSGNYPFSISDEQNRIARLFLCDNVTGSEYEFTLQGDGLTWETSIPTTVGSNFRIERRDPDNTDLWNTWSNLNRESYITYYITSDTDTPTGAGSWTEPTNELDVFRTQRTNADYSYDFSSVKLNGMTDVNTEKQNTLFTVPGVMYNYKSGGGDSWWNQFYNLDMDIINYYSGDGKITHPLVTGAPDTRTDTAHQPLSDLVKSTNIDDRLWYTNHNFAGKGNGGEDWDASKVGYPLQGLVAPYLSTNGELLSSENNVIMPYFDNNFLTTDRAAIYGSLSNPIEFPFRVAENGHYIFDSRSGEDNVYMNAEGKLVYNSSSSATIKNPTSSAGGDVGFFPFNTPIQANTIKNSNATLVSQAPQEKDLAVDYGFGMRLEIPFTVSAKRTTQNAKASSLAQHQGSSSSDCIYRDFDVSNTTGKYVLIKLQNPANVNVDNVRINGIGYWFSNGNATISYNNLTKYENQDVINMDNNEGYILVTLSEAVDITSVSVGYRSWEDATMEVYALSDETEITNLPKVVEDTVFSFSGDDDLWVYVDGKLALDVGGAHGRATGSINFTTGEVIVSNAQEVTATGTQAASNSVTNDWLANLSTGETHTISVFYMERGLYDSNLMIDMNLDVVDLTQKNGLTVTNTMDLSEIQDNLQSVVETIMEKDQFKYDVLDITKPTETLFDNKTISFPGNGKVTQSEEVEGEEEGIRDDKISIIQKEDERFSTSYSVTDTNGYKFAENVQDNAASDNRDENGGKNVTIQNKTPAADEDDVSITVDYLNKAKSSGFSVEKAYEGTDSASSYTFKVTYTQIFGAENTTYGLNGSFAGSTYTVYDVNSDAKVETKTVTSDSTIEIAAGQKAVFTGIPVNTIVNVTELNASKTFRNVAVSDSATADENSTFTTNDGTLATIALTNTPAYVFTNGDADVRRLVYYTEVGKTTNLPLPDELTQYTTITPDKTEPIITNHEKTATLNMSGVNNNNDVYTNPSTDSVTIENVQATINGSNQHTLTITPQGQGAGGYGLRIIKINGTEYYYNSNGTFGNGTITGTYKTLDSIMMAELNGSISIPFEMSEDGNVTVEFSYKEWNCTNAWTIVVDEGVTSTEGSTTEQGDPYDINTYDITGYVMTHDADVNNVATVSYENGDVTAGTKNTLSFTSKHVGYDKFLLNLTNNAENNITEKVEVVVYNYNVNDKVYVLDYGLKTDLFADTNGLLGGATAYDYDKNIGVTNKAILQDSADADGYTVLGLADSTVGQKYGSTVSYAYGADEFANSMKFNQASVLWDEAKLLYTPEKFMSYVDTFYLGVQVTKDGTGSGESALDATNATPVMTAKVDVMPANIVYYEDNFSKSNSNEEADGTNGIIYSGNVTVDGNANTDSTQSNEIDMQYGYDPTYANQDYGNSDGSSHELGQYAMAAFEFTGTGFDIISRTNRATGVVVVNIYEKTSENTKISKFEYENYSLLFVDNGNLVKSLIVDTSYENGDLYQIPVITWRNESGAAGDYIVTITSLQGNNESAKSIFIDGIRIYNPLKGNTTAEDQYDINNELNSEVKEAKQLVLGENFVFNYDEPLDSTFDENGGKISLAKYTGDGATFLSGKSVVEAFNGYNVAEEVKEADPNTSRDMLTYAVNGPNNELYLSAGYGIAFDYSDMDGYTGKSKTLQIGIKNVKGNALTLQYLKDVNGEAVWTDIAEIKSATELYYKLDTLENKYDEGSVYLRVTGDSGYASITNLKVAGYELSPAKPQEIGSTEVNPDLNPTDVTIKSGYNIKSQSFIKNTYAKVKITTPTSVDDIKVYDTEGKEIALTTVSSKTVNGNLEWTVKFKASRTENVNADTLYIVAYDENGVKSENVGFGKAVQ